ncbi:hypothetical protein EB796_012828 [Bugula neritina]|uniref:Uncharacterized protein n=1 Tax=Bugula neritina TaxID=10212 RepID=A0A7J7JSG9_BUGNE|nr:hypothetical protein EB796_012828 [Bugula neritina]
MEVVKNIEKKFTIPLLIDPRVQPKNASNRVMIIKKAVTKVPTLPPLPKVPEKPPTPKSFNRLVDRVPYLAGKHRGLLSDDLAHNLMLLLSLTQVLKSDANKSVKYLATGHQPPRLDEKTTQLAYLKTLQLVLPLLDMMKSIMQSTGTVTTLKKLLYNLEANPAENELAASLAALHNGKFEEACKYLYKYFESKTDVTFIGEPFPWDLTDVCGELLESGEITPDRYHSIHAVLAQAQMRRGNYSEALYYWNILLSEIDNSDKRIDVCIGVATCCSHLQQWDQGLESLIRHSGNAEVDKSLVINYLRK